MTDFAKSNAQRAEETVVMGATSIVQRKTKVVNRKMSNNTVGYNFQGGKMFVGDVSDAKNFMKFRNFIKSMNVNLRNHEFL
jgi:hypothetical protein